MRRDPQQAFIQEVWGLQGTAYFVVALRYYSRLATLGWRNLAWDDAIMAIAIVVYTAESLMAYIFLVYWKNLANNSMTDEQRANLDPNSEEWYLRVNGSKSHIVGLLLYTTLLWLLKTCWLIYYARLTNGLNKMKRVIRWGAGIVGVTYISCLLVAFLKCIPFNRQWQINPSPGNNCMPAISSVQTIYVMITNTLTDFYLMAIPLPVVWKSHLPWRKKLVLMIMFSGGFLEMTFGILRCVSILTLGDADPAESGYWSVRESFVSFVLTNMPILYPLFRDLIEKGRSAGRSGNGSKKGSPGYRLGSLPSRLEAPGKRRQGLSIPNGTSWGSNEHIVSDRERGATQDGEQTSFKHLKHQTGSVSISAGELQPRVADGGEAARNASVSAGHNGIVVTTEYRVTEESSRVSKNLGELGF
ncbi:hypothetical protein AAE478_000064 [Parahypoxylon ruwenzoriense]